MLLLAASIGCGSDVPLGRVAGIVRVDGVPLSKGTVRFVPSAGRAASGQIQPDGTFTLGTYGKPDGALVGTHEVAIIAFDASPVQRTAGGRPEGVVSKPLVPQRYMSPGTSGLTYDVKPGNNEVELDLNSK
jgi:hypothetical protein